MIVNLVGPPAAGKSTFAARYVAEHPFYKYCTIDAYREAHKEEEHAWTHLTKDMVERRDVILESCGLDWRLHKVLDVEAIRRRPVLTVCFDAPYDTLKSRVDQRHTGPRGLHTDFIHSDEIMSVKWVQEHLHELRPSPEMTLNTGVLSEQEVYEQVSSRILQFRVENETRNHGRRKEDLYRRKK